MSAPLGDPHAAGVQVSPFGRLPGGEEVRLFTLRSSHGVEARIIPLGGALVSLRVPDREGRLDDVVLGYDELDGYRENPAYLGTLVGRFANRIRQGRFWLEGREHVLAVNDPPNHLHGGPGGFHKALWDATPLESPEGVGVALAYTSPDGEEGYPGTLEVQVVYRLTGAGELEVEYSATTDRPTPVNLTQHSYFNLAGDPERDVLGHELELAADHFIPVDEHLIPTGEVAPVEGTPFDFRRSTPVGARIGEDHPQLLRAGGYDHTWVLRGEEGEMRLAARVLEPTTGRVLEVHTTEPGVQLYTGNSLDGRIRGKLGRHYARRTGLCLETQHFPDSPNHPTFPSTTLHPGERFGSRTVFRFGVG